MAFLFGLIKSPQAQNITISSFSGRLYQSVSKLSPFRVNYTKIIPKLTRFLPDPLISKLIIISLLVIVFTLLTPSTINADHLNSSSFTIEDSTINIGGNILYSPSFGLGVTVGQTAQGEFNSSGYTVKAGFQYIYPLTAFTFTISNLDVNFGSLIPESPSTSAINLTVTTGSAYGYAVRTVADHALRTSDSAASIPNTGCDTGTPCTTSDANVWSDNTVPGFGYNMSGDDVDTADFVDSTYYRPFPIQGVDTPVTVMSRPGIASGSGATATATYKVNVLGTQAAGTYQNNITYIAIPSF